jgi:hypothetical protein
MALNIVSMQALSGAERTSLFLLWSQSKPM